MTEPVVVEPMQRHHLRDVRRIDASAYAEPWSRQLWLAELDRADRWYRVAWRAGRLVGHCGAMRAGDDAHVLTMATAPAARRQGVATRLLADVVKAAVADGCRALTLEVRVGNTGARELYRRFGMVPAGIRRGYYRPEGEDAVIMWAHDIDSAEYATRLAGIEAQLEGRSRV